MRNGNHEDVAPSPTILRAGNRKRDAGTCLFCGEPLTATFVDLGMSPLCESYLSHAQLNQMEPFYPLHVHVCGNCFLVQLQEYVSPKEIFTNYAYFSSYSETWVEHMKEYAGMIARRLRLDGNSFVVEIGSNDGYMLQHFIAQGIPVLGIEPAANIAKVAQEQGIPTLIKFFGRCTAYELAAEGKYADLIACANVLAQVPDVNDFVSGIRMLLKPHGVVTVEFPHLMRLIEGNQFDTIYHEHFSYFSFLTVEKIFAAHSLTIFDVEELTTHGGSLRIYACHADNGLLPLNPSVEELRNRELEKGFARMEFYMLFAGKINEIKRQILDFLIDARRRGRSVAGYGAPGKGNTLLNYCGVRTDFIDYTVDRNPHKQGMYLPGTHIPIHPPERILETKPDYVMILPWNFKDEIMNQNAYIREWGGKFVVPIPELKIFT